MIDVDFIKWMCEKAEGFDLINDGDDVFPELALYYDGYSIDAESSDIKKRAQYQLLLQRAIEGVNISRNLVLSIDVSGVTIEKWDSNDYVTGFYLDEMTIDKAKESALKYIYQQES